MADCIFCKIVRGESLSYKIWEGKKHLAFLSLFPNTFGTTIVIPKEHYASYTFDLPDEVLTELILATKRVAKLLDAKLEDVGRTAVVFEGFGIDHVHAKLFPMHGTADMKEWKPIESEVNKYFNRYEGYISSHSYKREDDKKLAALAREMRS
ncbi:MAG: HIT family protein [bacterium]|nr:HIT family protein [bacterium]